MPQEANSVSAASIYKQKRSLNKKKKRTKRKSTPIGDSENQPKDFSNQLLNRKSTTSLTVITTHTNKQLHRQEKETRTTLDLEDEQIKECDLSTTFGDGMLTQASVLALNRIQNRLSELRKIDALKQGLTEMVDFDGAKIAESIMQGEQLIREPNLRSWCGLDGWEINFDKVIDLMKSSSNCKFTNFETEAEVTKEEFLEFLLPKTMMFTETASVDLHHMQILNEQQREMREALHKMQLLDLFKQISSVYCARTVQDEDLKQQLEQLWESKFSNEKGSVMINIVQEWIEE